MAYKYLQPIKQQGDLHISGVKYLHIRTNSDEDPVTEIESFQVQYFLYIIGNTLCILVKLLQMKTFFYFRF